MDSTFEVNEQFTERQRQVAALIAAGCSNEEVGARLGISSRTAKAHADVLRYKLGVRRRRQIPLAYRKATGCDPLDPLLGPQLALSSLETGDPVSAAT
jgi:ATP/maltotriose-dependent transcriptional regulator MalT